MKFYIVTEELEFLQDDIDEKLLISLVEFKKNDDYYYNSVFGSRYYFDIYLANDYLMTRLEGEIDKNSNKISELVSLNDKIKQRLHHIETFGI